MTKPELKIALIGSAPSSVRLAPYGDPSWQIWACSPGTYGIIPRCDMFFEPHRWEPGQPWFSPEYCQWLASRKHPVMMAEVRPEVPTSQEIPADELVGKYGAYFFTSSLAWMFVMAMEFGATKIGLFGVDMAATDEYAEQRSALHHFALIAASRGIEVGVPPESDLFRPRPLYGVDEIRHSSIKLLARRRELEARKVDAQRRSHEAQMEAQFLSGALDDLVYQTATWADRKDALSPPTLASINAVALTDIAAARDILDEHQAPKAYRTIDPPVFSAPQEPKKRGRPPKFRPELVANPAHLGLNATPYAPSAIITPMTEAEMAKHGINQANQLTGNDHYV